MDDLVLLHGAIGASDQLESLGASLRDKFRVHLLNFSGHGGKPFGADPFSIEGFAKEVQLSMEEKNIGSAHAFGYSMGGYVGMYLARHEPGKIKKLITLGTKYRWDETIAAREISMLDADRITGKLPAFAAQLEKRHAPNDWRRLLEATGELMIQLGRNNVLANAGYAAIQPECLLLLGDRDKMVSAEETLEVYRQLPNAQLGILPGVPHPVEKIDIAFLAMVIRRFLITNNLEGK